MLKFLQSKDIILKVVGIVSIIIPLNLFIFSGFDDTTLSASNKSIVNLISPLAMLPDFKPFPTLVSTSSQSPLATNILDIAEEDQSPDTSQTPPQSEVMPIGNQSIFADPFNELIEIVPRTNLPFKFSFDEVMAFQIKNSLAYLATNQGSDDNPKSHINIIDITSPIQPQFLGSLSIDSAYIQCLDTSAHYLVVATNVPSERTNRVLVYDIVDKANPKFLIQHELPDMIYEGCRSLHTLENHIYVAIESGILALEILSAEPPLLILEGMSRQILVLGNRLPSMALLSGGCAGKWGCSTSIRFVQQDGPLSLDVLSNDGWGGLWTYGTSIRNDELFLTSNSDLTIKRMSEIGELTSLCTIYSDRSTLTPFHSRVQLIGRYGVYLSDSKISSIDLTNIYYPLPGPEILHPTEPLAIGSEGKFVYVLDKQGMTIYETIWDQTEATACYVDDLSASIFQLHEGWEKHRCVESEVELVDELEIQALLAIHKNLGGSQWHYMGSSESRHPTPPEYYEKYGPWPIETIIQSGNTFHFSQDANPCSWEGIRCSCDGHVIELDLNNRNLQGDVPPEIGNFLRLEKLDIGYNRGISSLPPEIGRLKDLRSLDLVFMIDPNPEAKALPHVCIQTGNDRIGLGCEPYSERRPAPGCTFVRRY